VKSFLQSSWHVHLKANIILKKMKQCFIWVCHMCSNSAEVCFIFRVLFGYTEQL